MKTLSLSQNIYSCKSSKSEDNISVSLPHEILVEILTRLPIESFIRFRCVCKLWSNLIYDPSFANAHTLRSSPQPYFIIPLQYISSLNPYILNTATMKLKELRLDPDGIGSISRLLGSCNGLLLLETTNRTTGVAFQVANLVTGRWVTIPFPPNVSVSPVGRCFNPSLDRYSPPSLGLAYDGAASRKFKVVCYSDDRMCVLTLGKKELSWRDIGILHPYNLDWSYDPIFADGHLFWLTTDGFQLQPVGRIVTMDVAREVVYDITTPRCDGMYPGQKLILYEMDGSLCFASQMHFPFRFKIWVLKDSEKGEWMERYSIDAGFDDLNYVNGDKRLHKHNREPVCKVMFCRRKEFSHCDVSQWQSFVYESISWRVPSMKHVNTLASWEACDEED